jgi:hypothetical protein
MAFFGIFVFLFLGSVMHLGLPFSMLNLGGIELIVLFVPLLYGLNILLIIINAVRSYNNQKVYYKPAIPFLR